MTVHIVLIVAAAIQIVLSIIGFNGKALPLTITLIILGEYGMLATTKLYERSQFHIRRARRLRSRLNQLYPDAQVEQLQQSAEHEHQKCYPVFMRIRLNSIWLGLYVIIFSTGILETILCLTKG